MMVLATGFALILAASQGEVYVARGDMLVIAGTPVRLHGIDLPAGPRPQANSARAEMQRIVQDHVVTCRVSTERVANHRLATCMADGEDIAAELVSRGHALDCERYSDGRYRELEPEGTRERLQASGYCQK